MYVDPEPMIKVMRYAIHCYHHLHYHTSNSKRLLVQGTSERDVVNSWTILFIPASHNDTCRQRILVLIAKFLEECRGGTHLGQLILLHTIVTCSYVYMSFLLAYLLPCHRHCYCWLWISTSYLYIWR